MERTIMACRRRSGWKAVIAIVRADTESAGGEGDGATFFVAIAGGVCGIDGYSSGDMHTCVDDVSILHWHEHRRNIVVPATAALECRNVC